MKVLVTGGAGFIGSHVVDTCIADGHSVIVLDNMSSGSRKWVHPEAKLYVEDIRSDALGEILATEKPDVVIHHAAQKSVPESTVNPILDAELNIIGLIRLLIFSRQSGTKKFIFASSGGALTGDADIIPTPETLYPQFNSPYAISKYTGEQYVKWFCNTHNIRWTVLRYANVYGPRQTPEGEAGVVPIFLTNLLSSKPSYVYTDDGHPRGTIRDYVYVSDVAEANRLALYRGTNDVFHIGSGTGTQTADLYDKLARIVERDAPLHKAPIRPGDVFLSCLDISKAKVGLGWTPKVRLEDGLTKTYQFAQGMVRAEARRNGLS